MVRLAPCLFRAAQRRHWLLPLLLRATRNLEEAQRELQWLWQGSKSWGILLKRCRMRSRQYPLQYLLGDQPFGELVVKVHRNVLIPRWETEEWTMKLANAIRLSSPRFEKTGLRILDLCSGTGCIPLLLYHELYPHIGTLRVSSADISSHCIHTAKENLRSYGYNSKVRVIQDNALKPRLLSTETFDLITCNPPYIPLRDFTVSTSKSVKLYEPKLALIGDLVFYNNLVRYWLSKTNAFFYELGYQHQYDYVKDNIDTNVWSIHQYKDSNNKLRCIYGYRRYNTQWEEVFTNLEPS